MTVAVRIVISPEVVRAAPQTAGQVAAAIVDVANNPTVNQTSPAAAAAAGAAALQTLSTPTVSAALGQTTTTSRQTPTSPLTPAERFNDTRPPSEENLARRGSAT